MTIRRLLCIPAVAALAIGMMALPASPAQAARVTPNVLTLYDIYTGATKVQQCMADGRAGLHVEWSSYVCEVYHDAGHEALFVNYL